MGNSGFKTAALLLLGVFLTDILPAQEQEGLTFVAQEDAVAYGNQGKSQLPVNVSLFIIRNKSRVRVMGI